MCNVAPAIAAHTTAAIPNEAERFADRMIEVLNAGAVALMTSLGHRTGLFDVMADMPPASSHEIAGRAGFNITK